MAVKGRDIVGWMDLAKLGIILRPGQDPPVVLGEPPLDLLCMDVNSSIAAKMFEAYLKVFKDVVCSFRVRVQHQA